MVARSNIEEADVLGVGLDEQAARLDLVAHQHREEAVRRGRVFDVDANQQPARRIHRRLPQLRVVHLAETLETVELASFARSSVRCRSCSYVSATSLRFAFATVNGGSPTTSASFA